MYTESHPNTSGIKSVQCTHTHIHDSMKGDLQFHVVRKFGMKLYNDQCNAQVFNLFIYLLLPYMFRV
jgi:hypothetical protein